MMYRPVQLIDGLFQLSTFTGAATKTALQTAQLKQQNKQVAL